MSIYDSVEAGISAPSWFDADALGAETVVFTTVDGVARTVWAIVDRNPPAVMAQSGEAYMPSLVVECANNAVTGISTATDSIIGATITVAGRQGKTAQVFTIRQPNPIAQDAGGVRIAL
jgi:phage-related protein